MLAGCRFAHFLQYGLRALPWKQAEFDAPLFGSFVHDVLEHVVREAQAQGVFAALTDAQVAALTERCMDACMQTYLPQGDARASREGYLSTRNRQEAAAVVLDVARELRLSQFTPAAEELTFAPGGQMPPIVYHATRGDGLLTGKIDAVVIDKQPAEAYVAQNEGLKILDTEYVTENYAIGVSKDNTALRDAVNNALKELIDDGTVQAILDQYIKAE